MCVTLARHLLTDHIDVMFNILSILIGLVALVLGIVPFLPFFAWGYWFVIPIAIVGAAFGALSSSNAGRNLNLVLIVIFSLRLMLGGGVI
jgi:hypothetical protein